MHTSDILLPQDGLTAEEEPEVLLPADGCVVVVPNVLLPPDD